MPGVLPSSRVCVAARPCSALSCKVTAKLDRPVQEINRAVTPLGSGRSGQNTYVDTHGKCVLLSLFSPGYLVLPKSR
jgi:hypothetical protein